MTRSVLRMSFFEDILKLGKGINLLMSANDVLKEAWVRKNRRLEMRNDVNSWRKPASQPRQLLRYRTTSIDTIKSPAVRPLER